MPAATGHHFFLEDVEYVTRTVLAGELRRTNWRRLE